MAGFAWDVLVLVLVFVVVVLSKSIHLIGPAQIGLVTKRFALKKLPAETRSRSTARRGTRPER